MTDPMTDLVEMLRSLDVEVRPEPYVFATMDAAAAAKVQGAEATIVEAEGVTVVLSVTRAKEHGFAVAPTFAWLTLTIRSSLEAVGLTAAFSRALAEAGISCNVLAGYHHDHLLVAYGQRVAAVGVLRGLRDRS